MGSCTGRTCVRIKPVNAKFADNLSHKLSPAGTMKLSSVAPVQREPHEESLAGEIIGGLVEMLIEALLESLFG